MTGIIKERYITNLNEMLKDLYFNSDHYSFENEKDLSEYMYQTIKQYLTVKLMAKLPELITEFSDEVVEDYLQNEQDKLINQITDGYFKDAEIIANELYFNKSHYDFASENDLRSWIISQID